MNQRQLVRLLPDMSRCKPRYGVLQLFRCLSPFIFPLLLFVIILMASPAIAVANDSSNIRVSASVSSGQLAMGERFTLNVDVHSREPHNVSRPELPRLEGMRYLSTVPRTSTSYSLVNGVAEMTYRYSYTVEATDSGAYQIPAVYIDIDGNEYQTEPVTIVIQSANEGDSRRAPASQSDRPSIYLDLELSENQPVRGQQIVAEIVLYFQNTIEVNTFHISRSWQTEGFWRVDLNESQTRRPETVILDGIQYRRAVLARYALFPTSSGELTIPPFAIRTSVRQSSRFRDQVSSFFDGFGPQRDINLETTERTLQVHSPPLPPDDGQDISALGQFTIKRTLSQDRVKLGEAVDVITEINGSGNLGLINRPAYDYPRSFDTHRPREVIERNEEAPRMAGTKQFRDVLIARSAGTFTIPETTILVFNDATRRYEQQILPELTLEVIRDPNARVTLAQNDDFRLSPVRGSVVWQKESSKPFYFLWWFWFALAIPSGLFIMGYRKYHYQKKLSADREFYRYEQAWQHAMTRLDHVVAEPDPKAVYSGIYKAVSNFITDRLHQPSAGFTDEQLAGELRKLNVESPLVDRVYQLLNKCSTIRYAPDHSAGDAASDLAEARNIISELKLQL